MGYALLTPISSFIRSQKCFNCIKEIDKLTRKVSTPESKLSIIASWFTVWSWRAAPFLTCANRQTLTYEKKRLIFGNPIPTVRQNSVGSPT